MTDCTKNTFKVNLKNFQSISNASLEFVQGINIIVGQSNSGKSAIIRAIKGAVLNPNGSQKYIKNGTKGFNINIEYAGNSIEWSREKSPKYIINGEEYLKVGNSNLTDVLNKSGFVLDESNNLMNIESELELPFPFDKNNSELFKLFEKNIFCVSDSTSIIKLIKADEDNVSKNKENAEYELDRSKKKLEALEQLESEIDIKKLIQGRNCLAELIGNKEEVQLDINKLSDIINIGKVLHRAVPMVEIDINISHNYIFLQEDIKKLCEIRGVGSVLKAQPTASTPTIVDTNAYLELQRAVSQLIQIKELILILRALEAPRTKVIDEEYTSLRNDLNMLSQLSEQAQNLQNDIKEKKVFITKLVEEKKKIKVCPLCGREINESNEKL